MPEMILQPQHKKWTWRWPWSCGRINLSLTRHKQQHYTPFTCKCHSCKYEILFMRTKQLFILIGLIHFLCELHKIAQYPFHVCISSSVFHQRARMWWNNIDVRLNHVQSVARCLHGRTWWPSTCGPTMERHIIVTFVKSGSKERRTSVNMWPHVFMYICCKMTSYIKTHD